MILVLETNGKGWMCWIAELPGAFIRGPSRDDVHRKLDAELHAYANWLDIPVPMVTSLHEVPIESTAMVEDGDTNILIDADKEMYSKIDDFDYDCGLLRLSAQKAQRTYDSCWNRDRAAPGKQRKTFYGDVPSTIEAQYMHVVAVQQYYLENIRVHGQLRGDLEVTRQAAVDALRTKYLDEGNRLNRVGDEDWTVRKVIRRMIWHDRIHERAMRRMNRELCT